MTNKTRNKILTRIESALEEGFYLRTIHEAKDRFCFTSDVYGGCCVLRAILADGLNNPSHNKAAAITGITLEDVQNLERGFEGWDFLETYLPTQPDRHFYELGQYIAKTYR